jgi:uncharacterized SAM-binding protein YcdF (DUF218 family)
MITWRRPARIFLLCIGAVVVGYTTLIVNVYRHGEQEDRGEADAIVVLGAAQWHGKPSPMFQARLDRAYMLYQSGYASFIFITGGVGAGSTISDAHVGKEYLVSKGVDEHTILIEEKSRTTWQNLNQVKSVFDTKQFNTMLLVSHDFHIMRAKKMARDLGMEIHVAPVRTNNALGKFGFVTREAGLYLVYLLFEI